MAAAHADSLPDDPLQYLFSLEQFGVKLDLDNITAIVEALGHPERAYPTAHIAGTNGKGSVAAMLESMLRQAGHRTGRYTSPHLVNLTERFAINGQPVSETVLRDVVTSVRQAVVDLQRRGALEVHPTFFEITTASAFEIFRRAHVDVAVCEVGLGGRLDATNVLTPSVCAITTIARDHEQYLGSTLSEIAREKAGIIKPGVAVVVGELPSEAMAVITQVARERGATVLPAAPVSPLEYGVTTLGLAGAHQVDNARIAIRLAEQLDRRGVAVPRDAIIKGLADVRWPGRLERIRFDDGRDCVLDAAHNPAGAETLAAFLRTEERQRTLVFAAMRDKDVEGILGPILSEVAAVIVTRASNPRSEDPANIAPRVRRLAPALAVDTASTPSEALRLAWRDRREIVVAGSIFLLGDVMKALGRS